MYIFLISLTPNASLWGIIRIRLGFKDKLKEHYGSVLQGWLRIDADGTGRLEEREMEEVSHYDEYSKFVMRTDV